MVFEVRSMYDTFICRREVISKWRRYYAGAQRRLSFFCTELKSWA